MHSFLYGSFCPVFWIFIFVFPNTLRATNSSSYLGGVSYTQQEVFAVGAQFGLLTLEDQEAQVLQYVSLYAGVRDYHTTDEKGQRVSLDSNEFAIAMESIKRFEPFLATSIKASLGRVTYEEVTKFGRISERATSGFNFIDIKSKLQYLIPQARMEYPLAIGMGVGIRVNAIGNDVKSVGLSIIPEQILYPFLSFSLYFL